MNRPLFFSTVCIIALPASSWGQATATLIANDVRMVMHANGFIGPDPGQPSSIGMEIPAASGHRTLNAAGLWASGVTSDGQVRVAAHLFNDGSDFYPGPLTVDGLASVTQETMDAYDHVWSVTAAQVAMHRAYFACMNDPNCVVEDLFPDGYTIPPDFFTWPAMGDVSLGQATYLAPFVDFDLDGDYDPAQGDHPCILGDQALYAIFNDKGGPHQTSGSLEIGLEVHMMAFAYDDDAALDQTVFVQYKIIDRGTLSLSEFFISHYADLDLGCSDDDVIGTDAQRAMVHIANGDATDDGCIGGATGYGVAPPAFGMVSLKGPLLEADGLDNAPLAEELYVNGTGFGDGIVDNERFGLSNSMAFYREGPQAMTDPANQAAFMGYARATWKDGMLQTHAGTGYSSSPSVIPTLFAFPGDTDPNGTGTNGIPQSPWSATLSTLTGIRDPRVVANMGHGQLEPGEHINLLMAYVYARPGDPDPLASVAALQTRVDSVRAFADELPGMFDAPEEASLNCNGAPIVNRVSDLKRAALNVYPVPAHDRLFLRTAGFAPGDALIILDARGQVVQNGLMKGDLTEVDLTTLPPGFYLVRTTGKSRTMAATFIKE
ncbi:MAG: T9SS type A sorting domain-containing protein [Flavobacteriales bacterium]|nr:T9SS type A sorting domain-containing protein [Flavobacteriales bacterium]